jgi:hypothetical protein
LAVGGRSAAQGALDRPFERPVDRGRADGGAIARETLGAGLDGVPRTAHAKHTSPTGFSGVPPAGPATPVTATATSAPLRAKAPAAISRAVASLAAPSAASVSGRTPSISTLAALEYVMKPRSNHAELPATSVIAPAMSPPVQDSAVAMVHFRSTRARPTRTASSNASVVTRTLLAIVQSSSTRRAHSQAPGRPR